MSKKEFIKILYQGLNALPQKEVEEIVSEYQQHFIEGNHHGFSEEDICASLGDPRIICYEFLAAITVYGQKKQRKTKKTHFILRIASFGFLFLTILIPVFIAILATFGALFISGIAIMIYMPITMLLYFIPGVDIISSFSMEVSVLLMISAFLLGYTLFRVGFNLTIQTLKIGQAIYRVAFAKKKTGGKYESK